MSDEFKNDTSELTRVVNRANAQSYKNNPIDTVSVDGVGTYTVGIMDRSRIEVLSMTSEPENLHVEVIDATSAMFFEESGVMDWVSANCKRVNEAVTFNVRLENPLSTGADIAYFAVFKDARFKPAVHSLLERQPKYWVIAGLSLEEVEDVYLNRRFEELCGE